MNNEVFTNLSSVTLYKTVMFNEVDTTLFESAAARDFYFDSIPDSDKLVITDFTPLYEGRSFNLPYNYLDLKRYNTMKLYYNDSLGHEETYYCNVDNYIYVGTNTSTPIYRIDYFLTYGHLLYNKDIEVMFDRRTLSNNNINKNMKLDDISTPRIRYTRHENSVSDDITNDNDEVGYYIYLNNKSVTGSNNAVKGFKVDLSIYVGKDEHDDEVYHTIDTQTIGCYVAYADKEGLDYILKNENADYIEKIIGVHFPMVYLSSNEHYRFVTSDVYLYASAITDIGGTVVYMNNVIPFWINDYSSKYLSSKNIPTEHLIPSDYKKYDDWNPIRNVIIQGNEFDPKDFDDSYLDKNISDVVTYSPTYSAGLYIFNGLGNTYVYPVGYREKFVNRDYSIVFQSGRNFPYVSDYQNTLAYKQLLEYNTQQEQYTIQNANIQTYYQNQLLANQNAQLDISKQQNMYSYRNQVNSLNTQYAQNGLQAQLLNVGKTSDKINLVGGVLGAIGNVFTGRIGEGIAGGIGSIAGYGLNTATKNINLKSLSLNNALINQQIDLLGMQTQSQNRLYELQQAANSINTMFQCDIIALNRDNTLANIAISNKYNNAQPGAYKETDFTQIMSCYYTAEPYVKPYEDYTTISNLRNHYNIYGLYIGYAQTWKPGTYEGHFFDYIKGSIINNKNILSEELTYEKFLQLSTRIENGVRIWRNDFYEHGAVYERRIDVAFGDLTVDNTYEIDDSKSWNLLGISNERRMYLEDMAMKFILEDLRNNYEGITVRDLINVLYNHWDIGDISEDERRYINNWCYTLPIYESNYTSTDEYNDYSTYISGVGGIIGYSDLTYNEKVYTFSKIKVFSINALLYGFITLYNNI